jgi:hypothetical protein
MMFCNSLVPLVLCCAVLFVILIHDGWVVFKVVRCNDDALIMLTCTNDIDATATTTAATTAAAAATAATNDYDDDVNNCADTNTYVIITVSYILAVPPHNVWLHQNRSPHLLGENRRDQQCTEALKDQNNSEWVGG